MGKKSSRSKFGFSFIELIIVIGIISIIVTIGSSMYTAARKNSRDTRRKADLEQIRAAVESYRSDQNYYPSAITIYPNCNANPGLIVGTTTYIIPVPSDPLCNVSKYIYQALPAGCAGALCNDYNLGTRLEGTSPGCTSSPGNCKYSAPAASCNYCLGPYGKK